MSVCVLDEIMDVVEAAEKWGTKPDYVKRLCQQGKVKAKRIGRLWILVKNQPSPLRNKVDGWDRALEEAEARAYGEDGDE